MFPNVVDESIRCSSHLYWQVLTAGRPSRTRLSSDPHVGQQCCALPKLDRGFNHLEPVSSRLQDRTYARNLFRVVGAKRPAISSQPLARFWHSTGFNPNNRQKTLSPILDQLGTLIACTRPSRTFACGDPPKIWIHQPARIASSYQDSSLIGIVFIYFLNNNSVLLISPYICYL